MIKDFTNTLPDSPVELSPGDRLCLQFGQLRLEISHGLLEWTVNYVHWHKLPGRRYDEYGEEHNQRYVCGDSDTVVTITPMLADRPVVARPLSPITLMPDARTLVYISTPLWLNIQIGKHNLLEVPTVKLSDTWFGDKTGTGELCYSDTTRARLDLQGMENLPGKAITPITIQNFSSRQLLLDRINVPVPLLPLYQKLEGDRSFVTAAMTATLNQNDEHAKVELNERQGHEAHRLINAARKSHKKLFMFRTLDLFLN